MYAFPSPARGLQLPRVDTGRSLVGRYESRTIIRDTIYGKVCLGTDMHTSENVAVKSSTFSLLHARKSLESPEDEIQIHAHLSEVPHPNIIQCLDYGTEGACLTSVMEFAPGGELFEYIHARKQLGEAEARRLFVQLLSAVAFTHARGVAHLDISLENCLLDDSSPPNLKLTDFGMALPISAHQKVKPEGAVGKRKASQRGKLGYKSPEMFSNGVYDPAAADLYSCGVILFIMLVGCPPYKLPSMNDARFRAICKGDLRRLLSRWKCLDMLTPEAVDLMQSLLTTEDKRISLSEVVNHPWVTRDATHISHHASLLQRLLKEPQPPTLDDAKPEAEADDNPYQPYVPLDIHKPVVEQAPAFDADNVFDLSDIRTTLSELAGQQAAEHLTSLEAFLCMDEGLLRQQGIHNTDDIYRVLCKVHDVKQKNDPSACHLPPLHPAWLKDADQSEVTHVYSALASALQADDLIAVKRVLLKAAYVRAGPVTAACLCVLNPPVRGLLVRAFGDECALITFCLNELLAHDDEPDKHLRLLSSSASVIYHSSTKAFLHKLMKEPQPSQSQRALNEAITNCVCHVEGQTHRANIKLARQQLPGDLELHVAEFVETPEAGR